MVRTQCRRMHPGVDARARRRADWADRERVDVAHALCRQAVDIRGMCVLISVATLVPGAGVMVADPEDIRL